MRTLYYTFVTLHLFAAMTWIGGVLFLALVGAPALRKVEPPALRTALFEEVGMRFRYVGWAAVIVLLGSGTWLVWYRGWLSWSLWTNGTFWTQGVGYALAWKLAMVTFMLVLSLAHDLALSPSRARALDTRPDAARVRRQIVLMARVGALAAIGVVIAAARLVRG
ncbi:MAG: CopD family protein [Gemmatimonadaceae bacterium]|nr:CopD family protein [Gemmatimonadaceae bacterium]